MQRKKAINSTSNTLPSNWKTYKYLTILAHHDDSSSYLTSTLFLIENLVEDRYYSCIIPDLHTSEDYLMFKISNNQLSITRRYSSFNGFILSD